MGDHLKISQLAFIPILFLLHVLFTASSLALRLYEHFTPQSLSHTSPSNPPKHLALVLYSSHHGRGTLGVRALKESVKRAVRWAGEKGIQELSIWDSRGLLQECQDQLMRDLMRLPLSPPSSSPSSPPPRRRYSAGTNVDSGSTTPSNPNLKSSGDSVLTFTVFSFGDYEHSKPLVVHFLPTSAASSIIPDITKSYASLPQDQITQQRLDSDIKDALHFTSDPSLLIIHPSSPLPFWKAILPRPPPELHGYPFWPLRITEIYFSHHPTPLPLPSAIRHILGPMLDRAEGSSMPLIRKFARAIPRDGDTAEGRDVYGALRREEWTGAMAAYATVEQRLGR